MVISPFVGQVCCAGARVGQTRLGQVAQLVGDSLVRESFCRQDLSFESIGC